MTRAEYQALSNDLVRCAIGYAPHNQQFYCFPSVECEDLICVVSSERPIRHYHYRSIVLCKK